MKIKILLSTIITTLIIAFAACDDEVNSIGGSIQPGGDDIHYGVDTFNVTAKTILWDSIYAVTSNGLLGEYTDPLFGKIKSDYLCELYAPEKIEFLGKDVVVDSVFVDIYLKSYVGDTVSPMGLSIYKVNKKGLDHKFYTNIDPSEYTDMTQTLGKGIFTIQNSYFSEKYKNVKVVTVKIKNSLGTNFYDEWKRDPSTFTDVNKFVKFFPGMYITPTLGTGTLMHIDRTNFTIAYSYTGRNKEDTADSTRTAQWGIGVAPEVIQLNHVENKDISHLLNEGNPKRTYLKSPAGVYTEFTFPLNKIAMAIGEDTIINSAKFNIKGFTEEELTSGFNRPTQLLCINKDSIATLFDNNGKLNNLSRCFYITRTPGTNSYSFGDIATTINHYLDKYKELGVARKDIPDLKYILIPVNAKNTSTTSSYTLADITISNMMAPSSAVLRTDEPNMRFPIIYSKYNERGKK